MTELDPASKAAADAKSAEITQQQKDNPPKSAKENADNIKVWLDAYDKAAGKRKQ